MKTGSGLNALRLARAAAEIARLDRMLEWAVDDPAEAQAQADNRDSMMRLFLREQALTLAQILMDGGELPAPYAEARAELARLRAARAPDAELPSSEPDERAQ